MTCDSSVAGEPQINPVLLHVLQENYAIDINAVTVLSECGGEDESGQWCIDQESVFKRIEHSATSVPGFEVKRRVVLANFQFAKMAMVEDLKRNGDVIASSSIVAAVAGHSASRQKLAQAVTDIEPAQLDERPASDDYLVLDADSTQHRAIVLVNEGQNGVVHGPPGTGKSQTIANIIAQSVAEGAPRTLRRGEASGIGCGYQVPEPSSMWGSLIWCWTYTALQCPGRR